MQEYSREELDEQYEDNDDLYDRIAQAQIAAYTETLLVNMRVRRELSVYNIREASEYLQQKEMSLRNAMSRNKIASHHCTATNETVIRVADCIAYRLRVMKTNTI